MELDDPEPRPKDGRFTGTPIRLQRRTDREHRPQTDHRIDPARQGTLTRTAERLLPGRDHMRRTESTEMPDRILIRIRPCSFDEQGRAHYDEPSLLFSFMKNNLCILSVLYLISIQMVSSDRQLRQHLKRYATIHQMFLSPYKFYTIIKKLILRK